jgi:hypothetical protein
MLERLKNAMRSPGEEKPPPRKTTEVRVDLLDPDPLERALTHEPALVMLEGDLPGQVWIHLKDYQGNASDDLLLYTQKYWHDTSVAGIVPDITGVLDQQATVTVVAQCGAVGNAQTVNFTADRDVADLAQHTDLLECSISPRSKRKRPMHGVGRLELA